MGDVLDYARSYMTFFTKPHQGGNIARIQIDAQCRVDAWSDETFSLIAPCRSELMYQDGPLFQMPNYEFCGIFSPSRVSLIRTHWTSDRESLDVHPVGDRFDRIALDFTSLPAERLDGEEAIVDATLANRRLVARSTLVDEQSGATAVLEYPVKTMNVTRHPSRFQVDTGPVIVPKFDSTEAEPIARFAIAHVVYWSFDRAEFVLRAPQVVGERDGKPVEVTDYTEIRTSSAVNEIWAERV